MDRNRALFRRLVICCSALLLGAGGRQAPARSHEVRMAGTRFSPEETTALAGDTVRFLNAGGGLHNVQFFADSIAPPVHGLLERAMPGDKIGPLAGPLLLDRNETYAIVVPALPAGRYPFVCRPHYASGMTGTLRVVRR